MVQQPVQPVKSAQPTQPPQSKDGIPGFSRVTGEVQHRLVMSIQGVQKTGKTSFGLSAPGPIALINLDMGDEGVVHKFIEKKAIYKNDYRTKHKMLKDDYVVLWEKLKDDYYTALDSPTLRTIIFDTATDGWELCRLARHGRLTNVIPRDYDQINFEFKSLVKEALNTNKNVIFVHHLKDEYVNVSTPKGIMGRPTGSKIMAGFKKMPDVVQLVMETTTYDEKDENGYGRRVFQARVLDSRHDPLLNGMDFVEDDFNFTTVAMAMFPDTTEKDWE